MGYEFLYLTHKKIKIFENIRKLVFVTKCVKIYYIEVKKISENNGFTRMTLKMNSGRGKSCYG